MSTSWLHYLNHYSSYLIVCSRTLDDLLKGFILFIQQASTSLLLGVTHPSKGTRVSQSLFQLHLPHGRKERKQQCKARFDKIISTSININTENVGLQSFSPFWKAKKKHSAPVCLITHRKIWIYKPRSKLKIERQGEGGTSRRKMLLSLVIWNSYFWSKNTLQTSNTPSNWAVNNLRVWPG